jgi:hypothetical protein
VHGFFVCEYRGAIAAKNKGDIEMYFVNGIRPELARDAAGHLPNEKFLELYGKLNPSPTLTNSAPSLI